MRPPRFLLPVLLAASTLMMSPAAQGLRSEEPPSGGSVGFTVNSSPGVSSSITVLASPASPAQSTETMNPSDRSAQTLEQALDRAETLRERKSWRAVLKTLEPFAGAVDSAPQEQRWRYAFYRADAQWRDWAASPTRDDKPFNDAREALENLAETVASTSLRTPVIYADIQESLGDLFADPYRGHEWNRAWAHYRKALDFYAGQKATPEARTAWLRLFHKVTEDNEASEYHFMRYFPWRSLDAKTFDDARRIAETPTERGLIDLKLGRYLNAKNPSASDHARIGKAFAHAVEALEDTENFDDALFVYAEWTAKAGMTQTNDDGTVQRMPDFAAALELHKRIVREFSEGESPWWDEAQEAVDDITEKQLAVHVSHAFHPKAPIELRVTARNVDSADLRVYAVNLAEDIDTQRFLKPGEISRRLKLSEKNLVWTSQVDLTPEHPHYPVNKPVTLEKGLPAGSYVAQVGDDPESRRLIMVTDKVLTLKALGSEVIAYVADAEAGEPVADADVTLYSRPQWSRSPVKLKITTGKTNDDGILRVSVSGRENSYMFAVADAGKAPVWNALSHYPNTGRDLSWKVYAYGDKPAYRPEETVKWKAIVQTDDGNTRGVPSGLAVDFEIVGPRGDKISEGTAKLNAFGTLAGEVELSADMALGMYTLKLEKRNPRLYASTQLFRLEEYKLPEIKASVSFGQEGDAAQTPYRLGDTVDGRIQVEYYFGGPVTNAEVSIEVLRSPFYHYRAPKREFDWLFENDRGHSRWGGRNQQSITTINTTTDANGVARFSFDTPTANNEDLEYTVKAQVTDSSRREIAAQGSVKVTRKGFFAYAKPEFLVYGPEETISVTVEALDANDNPVATEGKLSIERKVWQEIWIGTDGERRSRDEMDALRSRFDGNVAVTRSGEIFRLVQRGYAYEDADIHTVETGEDGSVDFTFKREKTGIYRISFKAVDAGGEQIAASAEIWVADNASPITYRGKGLEMIVAREEARVGDEVNAVIAVDRPGSWVVITPFGDAFFEPFLVKVEGSSKVVSIAVEDSFVPNVYFHAQTVGRFNVLTDQAELVVPPVAQFLTVEVMPDEPAYEPGAAANYRLRITDSAGNPVVGEVSVGLIDEAIYAIQPELAEDIRKAFYGDRRYARARFTGLPMQFQPRQEEMKKHATDKARIEREGAGGGFGVSEVGFFAVRGGAAGGGGAVEFESDMVLASPAAAGEMRSRRSMSAGGAADPFAGGLGFSINGTVDELALDETAEAELRSDFRSSAFWKADIITDANGEATIIVDLPDSVTTWRATVRAITRSAKVGSGTSEVQTRLPIIARLQAPRFLVVGDEAYISGVFNNNTDKDQTIRASLEATGEDGSPATVRGSIVDGADDLRAAAATISVPAGGEARVDWMVTADTDGEVTFKLTGAGREFADAMEKSYAVHEHGIEKLEAIAGKFDAPEATIALPLPAERKPGSTVVTLQVTPSMATMMLDALPYLIDFPYGCTEQTFSRFVPAAIVSQTLGDLGLDEGMVADRAFGGMNLAAADRTNVNPSRGLGKMDAAITHGIKRLADMQQADGGWGWWSKGDTDPYMTAYAVWALTFAKHADIELGDIRMEAARERLQKLLVQAESRFDLQAWMLHALAARFEGKNGAATITEFESKAFLNLMRNREKLNAYSRALLALSAHNFGFVEDAELLVENLANGVQVDETPDQSVLLPGQAGAANALKLKTAHWGNAGRYYRWSDGGIEATAFSLMALMAIDPDHALVDPTLNWLVKNRRAANWTNTRDTAIVVFALNRYLIASGELDAAGGYEVLVGGEVVGKATVTAETLLGAPTTFSLEADAIATGGKVTIRRTAGSMPLYFSLSAHYFSQEEPITPAANDVFITRQYFRVREVPTLLKGTVDELVPLRDGDTVTSGDRIETVITVEGKNDLEYLMVEDLKPAGFESTRIHSGDLQRFRELRQEGAVIDFTAATGGTDADVTRLLDKGERFTGASRYGYQELRDRKVATFIGVLPQGIWETRYRFRAETPGTFHALPAIAQAMYIPEIRGNSAEIRVNVESRK